MDTLQKPSPAIAEDLKYFRNHLNKRKWNDVQFQLSECCGNIHITAKGDTYTQITAINESYHAPFAEVVELLKPTQEAYIRANGRPHGGYSITDQPGIYSATGFTAAALKALAELPPDCPHFELVVDGKLFASFAWKDA